MGTILVVDDDIDIAETVQSILELKGHVAILATDGRHALALLERLGWARIDLVITDMIMPELDGLSFLKLYRANPQAKAPLLAMSALEAYLDAALALGATAALRKPFEIDELFAQVQALLGGAAPASIRRVPDDAAERRRLRMIDELSLLSRDVEPQFKPFIERVAANFQVPMCLLSIIDERRQNWSAGCGIPTALQGARGGPRRESFCTHAVEARAPLIVQNAGDNPIFADNVLVRTENLQFYAGVPVLTLLGEAVGTLCVLDFQPRPFSHNDLRLLMLLARRASAEIRRREHQMLAGRPLPPDDYAHVVDPATGVFARPTFVELVGIEAARHIEHQRRLALVTVDLEPDALPTIVDGLRRAFRAGWIGRLSADQLGLLATAAEGSERASMAVRDVVGDAGKVSGVDLTGRLATGLELVRLATQ